MEDLKRLEKLYCRVVDPYNCQLSNIEQGGRIAGHLAQLLVGPKAFEAMAKVVLLIGGSVKGPWVATCLEEAAAAQRGRQFVSEMGSGVKATQTAEQLGVAAGKTFSKNSFKALSKNFLKKCGIENIHQFKEGFLGKNVDVSLFDIVKHTQSGELLIVRKTS